MSFTPPPPPSHTEQYGYQDQVVESPAKPQKNGVKWWYWALGAIVGIGACTAILPDPQDGSEPAEQQVAASAEQGEVATTTTTEPAVSSTESTTTTTEATSTTETTTPTEAAPESTASEAELEEMSRNLVFQLLLDDGWPKLGDSHRSDPESTNELADVICEVYRAADTDEDVGISILFMWDQLTPDLAELFDGPNDFASFTGVMAGVRCPDVMEKFE